MKRMLLNSIYQQLSLLLLVALFQISVIELVAQPSKALPLKAGKTYHIVFLTKSGDVTVIKPESGDGWALVNIENGFDGSDLHTKEGVSLNIYQAILIQEIPINKVVAKVESTPTKASAPEVNTTKVIPKEESITKKTDKKEEGAPKKASVKEEVSTKTEAVIEKSTAKKISATEENTTKGAGVSGKDTTQKSNVTTDSTTKKVEVSSKKNQEDIIADLNKLGVNAYYFFFRPASKGGGNGTYAGYKIDTTGQWGADNPNAKYEIVKANGTEIKLKATSKVYPDASVDITYDRNGHVRSGPNSKGF